MKPILLFIAVIPIFFFQVINIIIMFIIFSRNYSAKFLNKRGNFLFSSLRRQQSLEKGLHNLGYA